MLFGRAKSTIDLFPQRVEAATNGHTVWWLSSGSTFSEKRRSSWRFGRSHQRRFLAFAHRAARPLLSGHFCSGARLGLHVFDIVSQYDLAAKGSRCRIVQPFHNDNGQLMLDSNFFTIGFMWE